MNSPRVLDEHGASLPTPHPPREDQSLSAWFALNGLPLNTRCGGRGLCRGCEVQTGEGTVKACQCPANRFGNQTLRVPRASRHDASILGVSAFEVAPGLLPSLDRKSVV